MRTPKEFIKKMLQTTMIKKIGKYILGKKNYLPSYFIVSYE